MDCENLTDSQKNIVKSAGEENLSILAVAGSGKTTVLVCSALKIIEKIGNVEKALEKMLIITFTDEAATQLKERLLSKLREKYHYIGPLENVSTIHSFCNRILKDSSIFLGINPEYSVGDEPSLKRIMDETFREVLEEIVNKDSTIIDSITNFINMEGQRGSRRRSGLKELLFNLYEKTKVMGWTVEKTKEEIEKVNIEENEENRKFIESLEIIFEEFFKKIEEKKKHEGVLSYDDILYYAKIALENEVVGSEWKNRFDYIIVDEYQDTSYIQQEIIEMVGERARKIYAGDYFQSIYEWRDAEPKAIMNKIEKFSKKMNENFRSVPEIIKFSNKLFQKIFSEKIPDFKYIEMVPIEKDLENGGVYIFKLRENTARERRKEEAEYFGKAIVYLLNNMKIKDGGVLRKVREGDIAILFRSKTNMGIYAKALRERGIRYSFIDKESFFQTREINVLKDLLEILSLDDFSINDIRAMDIILNAYDCTYGDIYNFMNGRESPCFSKFMKDIEELKSRKNLPKDKIIIEFLKKTNFDKKVFGDYNGKQSYLNIYKFIDITREIEKERILPIKKFIEEMKMVEETENVSTIPLTDPKENSVRLMTIHSAKGLEFPVVFVADIPGEFSKNNDILFMSREFGVHLNIEDIVTEEFKNIKNKINDYKKREEMRILYVAFTRPKYLLFFSISDSRGNSKGDSYSKEILQTLDDEYLKSFMDRTNIIKDYKEGEIRSENENIVPERKIVERRKNKLAYISTSDIENYKMCPRYYYFTKMLSQRSEISESARRGIEFHSLMENFDFQLEEFSGYSDEIVEKAKNFLSSKYGIILKESKDIKREYPFNLNVDGTIFRGRFDLLIMGENPIVIDYKTGQRKDIYREQLLSYAYAYKRLFGKIPLCVVAYVDLNEFDEYRFSESDVEKFANELKEIIRKIENGEFQENKESCEKCPIKSYCKS